MYMKLSITNDTYQMQIFVFTSDELMLTLIHNRICVLEKYTKEFCSMNRTYVEQIK